MLCLMFTLPNDFDRFSKKSFNLIMNLLDHKGEGSLYQTLKSLGWIQGVCVDANSCL